MEEIEEAIGALALQCAECQKKDVLIAELLRRLDEAAQAPADGPPAAQAAQAPVAGPPAAHAAQAPVAGPPAAQAAQAPVAGPPAAQAAQALVAGPPAAQAAQAPVAQLPYRVPLNAPPQRDEKNWWNIRTEHALQLNCPRCWTEILYDQHRNARARHYKTFHYPTYFSLTPRGPTRLERFLSKTLGSLESDVPTSTRQCIICRAQQLFDSRVDILMHLQQVHPNQLRQFAVFYFQIRSAEGGAGQEQTPDADSHAYLAHAAAPGGNGGNLDPALQQLFNL